MSLNDKIDTDLKPTPKVAAAGVGGAAAIVAVWIAAMFGVAMPMEVATAAGALLAFAAGYFKKD